MDYSKYRKSGELSDLTVTVGDQKFKVHKFPLFTRSDHFKKTFESQSTSDVNLEGFPGGAATFETIADYLYGKQIDVNASNAVPIKCAVEYLKLNDDNVEKQPGAPQQQHRPLGQLADAVIADAAYTAKAKRDYHVPLDMLGQAANAAKYAEPTGVHTKLIDSFADSLAYNLNTSGGGGMGGYNPYGYYEPNNRQSNASPNNNPLSKDDIDTLNSLPLPWMLELIKAAQKAGLNQQVLANVIKNYLDYNTDLNPHYNEQLKAEANKPSELIAVAADVMKANKKTDEKKDKEAEPAKKDGQEPKKEAAPSEETNEKPSNLIKMVTDITGVQPQKQEEEKKPDEKKGEKKSEDKKPDEKAADPKKESSPAATKPAAEEAKKPPAKQRPPKKDLSNPERLKTVADVTKQLQDLNVNPPFPLPWLMVYKNALDQLGADENTKAAFNKWARDALINQSPKVGEDGDNSDAELAAIPPSVMVQLAKDSFPPSKKDDKKDASKDKDAKDAPKDGSKDEKKDAPKDGKEENKDAAKDEKPKVPPLSDKDQAKVVDLIDRYINELEKENKLTPEIFTELVSATPKDKRESYDKLMHPLLHMLKREGKNLTPEKKDDLLKLIDFNKLSEKTLEECKDNEHIPPKYVAEAALALVAKLRKELDDAKHGGVGKPYDYGRPSPTYNNPVGTYNNQPGAGYPGGYSTATNPNYTNSIYNPTPVYAPTSSNYNNVPSSNYNQRYYPSNTQPGGGRSTSATRSPVDSTYYSRPTGGSGAAQKPLSPNANTANNKVIYPIPVGRSGIETTNLPPSSGKMNGGTATTIGSSPYAAASGSAAFAPSRGDRDRSLPPPITTAASTSVGTGPGNRFDACAEFYADNNCADDYFYSTSYSYSTTNC